MHRIRRLCLLLLVSFVLPTFSSGQEGKSVDQSTKAIERGSKVYVAPVEGGFDIFL
jgi:hypothetical protein